MTARSALPPSLYAGTAAPAPDLPPLDGDISADVAIVGGGFTGLSTALHLAERGVGVVLLEAHEPGWGASGRNGGQVNPGLKHDPARVEADFGADLGRRMVAMSYAAPGLVFDLVRRHAIACEALQSGTLRAAFNAANAASVRASAAQGLARGMPVALLERDAVRAATGSERYLCALRDQRGGQLQPLSYARGLARAGVMAGARIHAGTARAGSSRRRPAACVRTGWCWRAMATRMISCPGSGAVWCRCSARSSRASPCRRPSRRRSCRHGRYCMRWVTSPSITGSMRPTGS